MRRYIYAAVLGDPRSGVRDVLLRGVSARQARLGLLARPVTRRLVIAGMDARAAQVPELERDLAAELDWFGGHLGGRRHLVEDRLGRADITGASLLAPLAPPAACPLYRRVALPPRVEAALARWSAQPALRWVARTYAEHRG